MSDPSSNRVAHVLDDETTKTADIEIEENIDFNGMLLSEPVLRGLAKAGFRRPSPIQLKAIPPARCGVDLIVQAKSGTGKTCVFVVIALETVVLSNLGTQVLILAPTREIARQSYENLLSIGCCLPGLKCACFIGGTVLKNDKVTAKQCHIVVGSPGRVCQLIKEGDLSIDGVRLFVLDEADKLMDESYQEGVNWIFSQMPENKQLIVLSATFPRQLDEFLSKYMKSPQMVKLDPTDVQLIGIKQYVHTVVVSPGEDWLEKKIDSLHNLLSKTTFSQCLIFCNFQDKVELLCAKLKDKNWPAEFIAAQLHQSQRSNVMKRLKNFRCRILVSTDLTARGIDAEHVNLVINFDVPFTAETYFHRIGRAGRFGGYGSAFTILCGWQTELSFYKMAGEHNFRCKKLPSEFPMDVVANESFFEALPPLEIPNLAALEKKAALKNARTNVNLQPEDFYGQLMKRYAYKVHRADPNIYKFNPTIVDVAENDELLKYDRTLFENVLRDFLGVQKNKVAANKPKMPMEIPTQNNKLTQQEVAPHQMNGVVSHEILTRDQNLKNVLCNVLNGVQENKVVDTTSEPTSLIEIPMENNVEQIPETNGDVSVISDEEENVVATDETNLPPIGVLVQINDQQVPAEKNETPSSQVFEHGRMLENVSYDVPDEQQENEVVSNELNQPVEITTQEDIVVEKVPEMKSETKREVSYFEAFNSTIDSHLCHLYGGFSWHYQRAKMIKGKDKENDAASSFHADVENVEPSYGKHLITYNRDEMLALWHNVVDQDPKKCEWYDWVESLGLFVNRYFTTPKREEVADKKVKGSKKRASVVVDDGETSDLDNCRQCWNAYEKVLKQYVKYTKSLSDEKPKALEDFLRHTKKYSKFIQSNGLFSSDSPHAGLMECQNVMTMYNRLMSSK